MESVASVYWTEHKGDKFLDLKGSIHLKTTSHGNEPSNFIKSDVLLTSNYQLFEEDLYHIVSFVIVFSIKQKEKDRLCIFYTMYTCIKPLKPKLI
jgi:hypothetical protein